jgi:hypothetical protein
MAQTRKRLTNVVSAANAMAVGLVAVRIVAVRKHPVGAESAKRPGDDTLTKFLSSSARRTKRT